MFRHLFLFLSRRRALRRWMETSSISGKFTRRFVAGQTLEDAIKVGRRLERDRYLFTLDHLGENVTNAAEAEASRRDLERGLQSIREAGLRATISVKLTQLGLDLSVETCRGHLEILTALARDTGSRVEIDMESSEYVDRTLNLVEWLHREFGCVRAVLQAYLYRTEKDLDRLNGLGIPVRLCKGAYQEPPEIAFPKKSDVDANYLKLTEMLMRSGTDPAIATHDPKMVQGALSLARANGKSARDFEFQMLYGVRRDLQKRLVDQGFRVRLYVPYGDAWYPYFMRRLAERPANVFFIVRNLVRA
jgi:proline dehydrogenase